MLTTTAALSLIPLAFCLCLRVVAVQVTYSPIQIMMHFLTNEEFSK